MHEHTTHHLSKFSNPKITLDGKTRASVEASDFSTIWFNTGTLCNLACENCYIESSPKNDRLVYIKKSEVEVFLSEIKIENYSTTEIGLTGGEPFMNPEIIEIISVCLSKGFEVLILTNAMKPMQKHQGALLKLKQAYPKKLFIRVSMDHYSEEKHNLERGEKAWAGMLKGLKWLSDNKFQLSVAGRTLWGESEADIRTGFAHFFKNQNISLDASCPKNLLLFSEMDEKVDVPEITTDCWGILNKSPNEMMCASSRMIVKRKGDDSPKVIACTLLPYQDEFELGLTLKESQKPIYLNHPHCSKFCVLGGSSCS